MLKLQREALEMPVLSFSPGKLLSLSEGGTWVWMFFESPAGDPGHPGVQMGLSGAELQKAV